MLDAEGGKKATNQDEFPVLPNTTEAVPSAPDRIKRDTRDESRMALAPRDDSGFARGKDSDKIVLPAYSYEAGVRGPCDL